MVAPGIHVNRRGVFANKLHLSHLICSILSCLIPFCFYPPPDEGAEGSGSRYDGDGDDDLGAEK